MDEELPPTTPLQEFLARLQQTMDRPPNTADPVRGERERLIAEPGPLLIAMKSGTASNLPLPADSIQAAP
jgi:hypothetical protein